MLVDEIGLTEEEVLQILVDDLVYAKENFSDTLLGEPKEVSYASGRLSGACTILGMDYKKEENVFVFIKHFNGEIVYKIESDFTKPLRKRGKLDG